FAPIGAQVTGTRGRVRPERAPKLSGIRSMGGPAVHGAHPPPQLRLGWRPGCQAPNAQALAIVRRSADLIRRSDEFAAKTQMTESPGRTTLVPTHRVCSPQSLSPLRPATMRHPLTGRMLAYC